MFIKKDKRKVNEILKEEGTKLDTLKLSKRTAEFQGNLRIICQETKIKLLCNLRVLNLYDNALTNIDGIGMLAQTPIEEINLGCNKLDKLPMEFGTLRTLVTLWLDDNQFESFPTCVCQLRGLKSLRLSGNGIKTVPALLSSLESLETLAIDNNELTEFPAGLLQLPEIKQIWIRQNRITAMPGNIDALVGLQVLSISSNLLEELPDALANLSSLKQLFANGNRIKRVPEDLCTLPNLQEVNLANNQLAALPELWQTLWGTPHPTTGLLHFADSSSAADAAGGKAKAKVLVLGNPVMQATAAGQATEVTSDT